MTDTLDEDHAQVAFGLLALNANLPHVYDGVVGSPTPDPPYVLVYTRVAWPRDGVGTALAGTQVTITTTWTCHCVGLTPAAARKVQGQVRSSLLGQRPVIAGRNCSPIKQVDALDPDVDETTNRPVLDAISIFDFMSTG